MQLVFVFSWLWHMLCCRNVHYLWLLYLLWWAYTSCIKNVKNKK